MAKSSISARTLCRDLTASALVVLPLGLMLSASAQGPGPKPSPGPPVTPTPKPLPTRKPSEPLLSTVVVRPSATLRPQSGTGMVYTLNTLTLEGIVNGSPKADQFLLSANDQVYQVHPLPTIKMDKIVGGDRVRVYGRADGLIITVANVRLLGQRASNSADAYGPQSAENGRISAPPDTSTKP